MLNITTHVDYEIQQKAQNFQFSDVFLREEEEGEWNQKEGW